MSQTLNEEIEQFFKKVDEMMVHHYHFMREREYENSRKAYDTFETKYVPARENAKLALKKLFTDHKF
jgi:hypothetical protein